MLSGDSCPSIDSVHGNAYGWMDRFGTAPMPAMASQEYSIHSNDRVLILFGESLARGVVEPLTLFRCRQRVSPAVPLEDTVP